MKHKKSGIGGWKKKSDSQHKKHFSFKEAEKFSNMKKKKKKKKVMKKT